MAVASFYDGSRAARVLPTRTSAAMSRIRAPGTRYRSPMSGHDAVPNMPATSPAASRWRLDHKRQGLPAEPQSESEEPAAGTLLGHLCGGWAGQVRIRREPEPQQPAVDRFARLRLRGYGCPVRQQPGRSAAWSVDVTGAVGTATISTPTVERGSPLPVAGSPSAAAAAEAHWLPPKAWSVPSILIVVNDHAGVGPAVEGREAVVGLDIFPDSSKHTLSGDDDAPLVHLLTDLAAIQPTVWEGPWRGAGPRQPRAGGGPMLRSLRRACEARAVGSVLIGSSPGNRGRLASRATSAGLVMPEVGESLSAAVDVF